MDFSADTEMVLDYLTSSGKELRKRNDLGALLEVGASANLPDLINALVFHGKNAWTTYSLLRRMQESDDGYQNLEKEFMDAINQMRNHLEDVRSYGPQGQSARIEATYLGMTQGTIRNLVDLSHDLALLKNLQNETKYGST